MENLVNEIQKDIKNEDFETAYIKAKQIRYTKYWSSGAEDKWYETRRAVIDQIIAAEKSNK